MLGLGTAPMGSGLDDDAALALLEEAVSLGVTYIDTAPALGGYGRAQRQLGQFLGSRQRDEVFLASKTFEPDGGAARRLLEGNLSELGTDHVDLAYVHSLGHDKMDPTRVFARGGVFDALMQAREEGLTTWVGVSGHNRPKRFLRALADYDLDVIMLAVNPVDVLTYDFEGVVWPEARRRGLGLVAMKVFGGPQAAGGAPARLPREHHDLAFRYALSLDGCATAVIGMTSSEELRENVRRAREFTPLAPQELEAFAPEARRLAKRWGAHLGAVE